ncbi:MAG: ribose transport system permease protein [Solirubrobacteraceae bacterium]|jgi:ribose transport system permease protein|nr:ribose transport system permease protein [Solirubrobacteraceae bacterium]
MTTQETTEALSPDHASTGVAPPVGGRSSIWTRFGPYWALVAWAVAILIFAIASPSTFATIDNLQAILGEQSLLAIAALAVTIPLICGHFDLSIGATIALSGLITAGIMSRAHLPWELAVVVGVAVGTAIGAANALLVAHFGVHSFIATLGTATIVQGFSLWYGGGQIIFKDIDPSFLKVAQTTIVGIPITVLYLLMLAGALWFVLEHTPYGRYLYAIGLNRTAAVVAGVRVKSETATSLIVCGALAGLVGVLLTSRSGSAQNNAGLDYLLPAFAAAFIGAATFRRGQFNAAGTVVGVYFVATLVSGAFILGGANYISSLISGAALIIAVIGNRAMGDRFGG